ncbi:MAG: 30S ribosomal protein S9 [Phycisphaerae bacterium]
MAEDRENVKLDIENAPKSQQETEGEQAQQAATSLKPTDPPEGRHWWWGTGRRKKSIARVRIRPGDGKFFVNKRKFDEFFFTERDRNQVLLPLKSVDMMKEWDVYVSVNGGGYTGQAGAVSLGLSRALSDAVPAVERTLRDRGLLTRDSRMKERKKYGQRGARRRFQFSKR